MDWDSVVTLFIGNVAHTLPDTIIRKILGQIGNVLQWRRALGVRKEPWDFGFVDFASPTEALRAMRIIPSIKILNLTWEVRIDNNQKQDIVSFDQIRKMRDEYDEEKEKRSDQLVLHMIDELIENSAFAAVVPRLDTILYSENDAARESENFRYINEVRQENEDLEERFRLELAEWKEEEIRMERQRELDRNRLKRDEFLKAWKPPQDGDEDYEEKWKTFNRILVETREVRVQEESLDNIT